MEKIIIGKLSARGELTIDETAEKLMENFGECKLRKSDLYIICYNAAKLFFCAEEDGQKVFSSPDEVFDKLTLEEIALAVRGTMPEENTEYSVNESFGKGDCYKNV